MRVSKISVKRLFHTFDHSIPLNLDGRITIIHGLNGLGKTTLLRMVKSLCSCRFYELQTVPFVELRIDFDDGSSIVVVKSAKGEKAGQKKKKRILDVRYLKNGVEQHRYEPVPEIDPESAPFPLGIVEHRVSGLSRVGPSQWVNEPTGEIFSFEDIIERFPDALQDLIGPLHKKRPEWIANLSNGIHVQLIETQRLLTPRRRQRRREYDEDSGIIPAIVMHSEELASNIQRQEREYGVLSQTLDRTFPIRYMQQKQRISMSDEELRSRFAALETKRAKLEEAGLLGKEDSGFVMPAQMDEATRGVLSIYVTDNEKKLGVFDELATRIGLFRKILNDHFMYKELRIHKEKGFRFFSTRTDEELKSTDLSSGEQHEVVVLYELLFHVAKNSLILIDEPEISLHIAWQEEFLRDLQQIIQLSPFDAVVATHSPQIVNDRWDLTVELTGPEEIKK